MSKLCENLPSVKNYIGKKREKEERKQANHDHDYGIFHIFLHEKINLSVIFLSRLFPSFNDDYIPISSENSTALQQEGSMSLFFF